jgi:hypothetical protein
MDCRGRGIARHASLCFFVTPRLIYVCTVCSVKDSQVLCERFRDRHVQLDPAGAVEEDPCVALLVLHGGNSVPPINSLCCGTGERWVHKIW